MIKQLTSNTSYFIVCEATCFGPHHRAFLPIKSVNVGYMLGSQLCLQLVPVYYV